MAENRPKALSGALSWSAYYAGVIVILEKIPLNVEGRNDEINSWRESLSMAKEYEAGRISKEDFYKWRQDANTKAEAKQSKNQKTRALCEYEAKAGAAGVQDTGRSGLNFDQMFKEKELFELCMKAKQ